MDTVLVKRVFGFFSPVSSMEQKLSKQFASAVEYILNVLHFQKTLTCDVSEAPHQKSSYTFILFQNQIQPLFSLHQDTTSSKVQKNIISQS